MSEEFVPEGKFAVFYTDGGARPTNPGHAGSGIHGYIYSEGYKKKPEIISNHFLTFIHPPENNSVPKVVPTNNGYMSCDKEGVVQGNAKPVEVLHYVDIVCSYYDYKTNNFAELNAILEAFMVSKKVKGLERLTILADSQYALDILTRDGDKWRANGWRTSTGSEVKNLELVQQLLTMRDEIEFSGVKIVFTKVKGHSTDLGNHYADYLATIGCTRSQFGDYQTEVSFNEKKRFWEPDPERHPMLEGRRFFYPRDVTRADVKTVFMVDPGGTDLTIGKRDHEGYSIVQLTTPCPSYEKVLQAQARYPGRHNWPMNLKTDRLYSKFVNKFLTKYGKDVLIPNKQGSGLFFLDGGPVATEHNPPALIYRVDVAFAELLDKLNEFQKLQDDHTELDFPEDYHGISALDITSDFFEIIEKKKGKAMIQVKQLKKDIAVGYDQHPIDISITVDGKDIEKKIPLTLGMDLPLRNSLKRIEAEDPKIILITWRTAPGSFQYGCIVECMSGIGIWSNYHCARFFV